MASLEVKMVKTEAFKDAHMTRAEISAMVGAEMVEVSGGSEWGSGLYQGYKDELLRALLGYGPHRLTYPAGTGDTVYEFSSAYERDEDLRWRLTAHVEAPLLIRVKVEDIKREGGPVFTCKFTDDDFEYFGTLAYEGDEEEWPGAQ